MPGAHHGSPTKKLSPVVTEPLPYRLRTDGAPDGANRGKGIAIDHSAIDIERLSPLRALQRTSVLYHVGRADYYRPSVRNWINVNIDCTRRWHHPLHPVARIT